jgi:arylsulfatase A-like enzyme
VFLSDNGGIDYRFGFKELPTPHTRQPRFAPDLREYDNAPLKTGKGWYYEGGVRVPLLMRWPQGIQAGAVIQTPVHGMDLMPTFLELAGGRAPDTHPLDGESLVALLRTGRSPELEQRPLYQYYPFYDLRWGLTPCATVRRGDYKLIEFFGDRVDADGLYIPGHHLELYNLRDDLGETTNLAETRPGQTGRLQALLHSWMKGIGAEVPATNVHYEPDRAFTETRDKPAWLPKS